MINEYTVMDIIGAFAAGALVGFMVKCMFRCTVPQYEIDIEDNNDRHHP